MLNLKSFHIFFISISIMVIFAYFYWQINHMSAIIILNGGLSKILAGAAFISGLGLILYLRKTIKLFKTLK